MSILSFSTIMLGYGFPVRAGKIGKISGTKTDKQTFEALIGTNVNSEDTALSADAAAHFIISFS